MDNILALPVIWYLSAETVKGNFRSRPEPRDPNKPKSEKTIKNETVFAYTSSFVKEISMSSLLKYIWENAKVYGENYYGRIFSANHKLAKPSGLTLNNIITPDNIFMKTNSIVWDDDYFSLDYKIARPNEKSLPTPFYAVSILFLTEPHKPKKDLYFAFLPFEEIVSEQFTDKPNNITFSFSDSDKEKISEYKKGIIYIAFIFHDLGIKEIEWTETAAVEVNIAL